MRIKHIFWVVSSQFIDTAELNELLINAKRKKKKLYECYAERYHVSKTLRMCVGLGAFFDWAAYLGFLNSFFFWMWLFVSKSPWSFLSYSLWILSCYKTNKSMDDSGSALTVRWTPPALTQLPPRSVFGRTHWINKHNLYTISSSKGQRELSYCI